LNQTGHSFASFLLGAVNTANRNVVASYFGHRWRSTGFYFMDDWKASRKLTLNLGLRWETIGGLLEVGDRQSALDFGLANPRAANRPGALVFLEDLGRNSFQNRYWWQMSPKIGFAYSMTNKLVMRGGYGINNTPPISNGFGFGGTNGYNSSINVNSNNFPVRFTEDQIMRLSDPFPSFQSRLPNKDATLSNGQNINYIAKDSNRLAYTQNWNFGFQYELPQSFVMELNYVGNKGTRLEAGGLDNLNALPASILSMGQVLTDQWSPASGVPQPFPGFTGTVLQALRPYPQFTGITQQFANFGTSSYNSMQLQVTRHFKRGLAILGAYTWSKAIGLNDSALDDETPADPFNRGLERSVTRYHIPHFFKMTWIYELPIGPNKLINVPGVAGKILGGWQLTGIHQIASGSALSISGGAQTSPLGAARLDLVPGVPIILNPDAPINFRGFVGGTPYLNRAAFAQPPVHPGGRNNIQRFGTLGPMLPNIRGPHNVSEDLGLWKVFQVDEHRSLEIRGVFLNPFNRVGRGNPVTDFSNPFFGQITGQQKGGRNIELSARVTF
jgi:TonB-dependent receptor-like protein